MPIVETKVTVRPNTSVDFFAMPDTNGQPVGPAHSGQAFFKSLRDAGDCQGVITLSSDQLTQTIVTTISDFTAWSAMDTALGIELDALYQDYIAAHNFTLLDNKTTPKAYTCTGVDSPFIQTNVYTFNAGDPTMAIFASAIALDTTINVTVGTRTVTVVKHFANSDDYTDNVFADYRYVQQLHANGVTRAITYSYA